MDGVSEGGGTGFMKREATLLNLICIIAALGFVALAVLNALLSASFLTTDNLFVTMVCLLMALMFAVNPLLYLNDQARWTLSLGLLQFRSQHDTRWELLMAASLLVTLPSIILYFFGQKTFVQGISTTGFK